MNFKNCQTFSNSSNKLPWLPTITISIHCCWGVAMKMIIGSKFQANHSEKICVLCVLCFQKSCKEWVILLASTQRYKYTNHTVTTSDLTLQDQSIYNEPYLVAIETRNVNCYPHSAGISGNLQPPKITIKLQRNLHNNLKANMTMGAVIESLTKSDHHQHHK
jgi:hypothetical protein